MSTDDAATTKRKPYLSPSQLDMAAKCGLQWQYRYVDGLKIPPAVAMVIGTATHKSIEKNLRSKMEAKTLLPEQEVVQIASEALSNTWAGEGPVLSDDEKEQGEIKVKGAAVDTAVSLARLHHRVMAPGIQPLHVEREVYLELTGFPHDLKGFLDIQEADGIRDTKTASKSPSGDEAASSTQGKFYSLARTVLDGLPPAKFSLDYLVKTKEPKAVTVSAQIDEDDHRRLLLRVEKVSNMIQKGTFTPAPHDAWYCSARWCGYWSRCPFGAKQKVQG